MTPVIFISFFALFLLTFLAAWQVRRHLPAANQHSRSSEQLLEQVRTSHERSVERTAALNRDLEMLRTGRGTRHD